MATTTFKLDDILLQFECQSPSLPVFLLQGTLCFFDLLLDVSGLDFHSLPLLLLLPFFFFLGEDFEVKGMT
jgi:hypothetical protein